MTIDGKKFSGNAQYLRHGRVMHHGTLLYNSDLSAVSKALQVDPEKIRAKGIESVRSRVTNIRRYMKEEVPLFVFREMLLDFIRRETESEDYAFSEEDVREIERIRRERYDTWEWNYGKSPECTILKSGRVEGCGTIEAFITTDRGLITGIAFYGDFFSTKDPEELTQYFIGKKPDTEGFTQALEGVAVEQYFTGLTIEELLKLLSGE
jgi:lipoate-protein ligase A